MTHYSEDRPPSPGHRARARAAFRNPWTWLAASVLTVLMLTVSLSALALLSSDDQVSAGPVALPTPIPAPIPIPTPPPAWRQPAVVGGVVGGPLDGQDPMHPTSVPLGPPPLDTEITSADEVKNGVAVPDGPAPDLPPYGIDAAALLDELRGHDVVIDDDSAAQLVELGNRHIARGDPDLNAWDVKIKKDVIALFPQFSARHVKDTTRCLAEYVERVIAHNAGTVPPDELDDHNG